MSPERPEGPVSVWVDALPLTSRVPHTPPLLSADSGCHRVPRAAPTDDTAEPRGAAVTQLTGPTAPLQPFPRGEYSPSQFAF